MGIISNFFLPHLVLIFGKRKKKKKEKSNVIFPLRVSLSLSQLWQVLEIVEIIWQDIFYVLTLFQFITF